jgi:hypothetical protein
MQKKKDVWTKMRLTMTPKQKKKAFVTILQQFSLNGVNPDSVELGGTYTDPGATAMNMDGSAVTVTTDASALNVDSIGTYVISYSATNDYGTVTAERNVKVYAGPGIWAGTWTATSDCSATQISSSS